MIINVIQVDEGWWQGTNASGSVGLFPATYVEVVSTPAASLPVTPAPVPVSVPAPVVETVVPPEPAAPPPAQAQTAVALYDYEPTEDNELPLQADSIITNINFVSDDWWLGTSGGATGLCKFNF